jgi:hypothetical protein
VRTLKWNPDRFCLSRDEGANQRSPWLIGDTTSKLAISASSGDLTNSLPSPETAAMDVAQQGPLKPQADGRRQVHQSRCLALSVHWKPWDLPAVECERWYWGPGACRLLVIDPCQASAWPRPGTKGASLEAHATTSPTFLAVVLPKHRTRGKCAWSRPHALVTTCLDGPGYSLTARIIGMS